MKTTYEQMSRLKSSGVATLPAEIASNGGAFLSTNEMKFSGSIVRFGTFEVDLESRELRKQGLYIRLEEKPFRILELLLEQAGRVVTRRALREKLWPDTLLPYGGQSAAELGLTPPLVFCVRIWQRGNTRWEADRIRAPAPRARRPLESAGGSGRERCNGDPGPIAGSLLPHRQSRNGLGVVDGRGAASVLEATPPHHSSVRDLWHVGSRLVDCVQSGTCQAAGVPDVKVAGKTGTATALDGSGATHAWFVGFAPAEQPEIALVVFLERGTGAQNAAPLAGKLLRRSQRDCGS